MINGKYVLAVIPARGGSKGVPRKNIRKLAGKPLIAWTIEEARKSKYIDRLILSSEDGEIMKVAEEWGCEVPFRRPEELAKDNTPGIAPVLHAIQMCAGYDYILILQPTSPLRNVSDIDGCIEHSIKHRAPACVSVTEPDKSPYWMFTLNEQFRMLSILDYGEGLIARRQDLPVVYALNGAVYFAECDWLSKRKSFVTEETVAYPMPKERSLDIDSEFDFQVAEFLLRSKNRNN